MGQRPYIQEPVSPPPNYFRPWNEIDYKGATLVPNDSTFLDDSLEMGEGVIEWNIEETKPLVPKEYFQNFIKFKEPYVPVLTDMCQYFETATKFQVIKSGKYSSGLHEYTGPRNIPESELEFSKAFAPDVT